jgi:hypothetical protein
MMNNVARATLLWCLLAPAISCNSTGEKNDVKHPPPMKDINAVVTEYSPRLMAIPGVVGVAVSELDDRTPCIWVMVKEETPELKKNIPEKLEGYPVVIHVSGEIRPMDSTVQRH